MIKIIIDSASDINKDYLKKHSEIDIINIPLLHKEKNICDLSIDEFYNLIENDVELPTTSQINPETYMNYFKRYKNDIILCICLSSGLSGTYSSANLAKNMLEDEQDVSNIYIFDSESATMGEGIFVEIACESIQSGKNILEVINILEDSKKRIHFLAVVDDLSYLYKGGRLSKTENMLGTALNIKPILTIQDKKVCVFQKARGLKKANSIILNEIQKDNIDKLYIGCCKSWDSYDNFKHELNIPFTEFQIGSIIGTHTGPKCYGAIYLTK